MKNTEENTAEIESLKDQLAMIRYESNNGLQSHFKTLNRLMENVMPLVRDPGCEKLETALLDLLMQINETGRCLGGAVDPYKAENVDVRSRVKTPTPPV